MSRLKRGIAILAILILLPIAVYAVNAASGYYASRADSGTIQTRGVRAPVQIVRDERGIPHIIARNDHDAFFAQGYAEGADRLFQIDLIRKFVAGRLSELVGAPALASDEHARIVPVEQIAQNEFDHMPYASRDALQAFSDGVNAAMQHEPLPVEYRLLLAHPDPWKPTDCLVVGFSTVLDLTDRWDDVIRRDAVAGALGNAMQRDLYAISDPAYDAPVTGGKSAPVPRLRDRGQTARLDTIFPQIRPRHSQLASNDFAVGALHATNGHALLANDPHLRLGVPGVWYLIDLRTPAMHVAGATLAGAPGVILGHNDHIAWGVTNGSVVTESLYRTFGGGTIERPETFHVRFGKDVKRMYYADVRGFMAGADPHVAVTWPVANNPESPGTAFLAIDRAGSIAQALQALRTYNGPPQNFVFADDRGNVAYHLAGPVPDDPFWGLRVHDASAPAYPLVPFDRLPHVDPSRGGVVFTANNRMYDASYPYQLSPEFDAPYRAYRIHRLLQNSQRYGVAQLFAIQSDTFSAPDYELARETVAAVQRKGLESDARLKAAFGVLRSWDGRFDGNSIAASLAAALRRNAAARLAQFNTGALYNEYMDSVANGDGDTILLMRVLRERPRGWWTNSDYDDLLVSTLRTVVASADARKPWSTAGAVPVLHPLAKMGFSFLNAGVMPGLGDAYSPHVLMDEPRSQSFRAVWDAGNWDAGGIIIPTGESGEPGSHHYTDLRAAWNAEQLVPLPFSPKAVAAAARATLTLTP